jgi:hypothetical protein
MNITLALRIVLFVCLNAGLALGMDSRWYFTPTEIANAYRYQEQFGRRLRQPLKPHECYYGKVEFVASFRGKEFVAPCRFITETMRHIKQMLEKGAARYLFPLDTDHAHLAVPADLWWAKYRKLPVGEALPELLREPSLVALYHTAEHLTIEEPASSAANVSTEQWRERRGVL